MKFVVAFLIVAVSVVAINAFPSPARNAMVLYSQPYGYYNPVAQHRAMVMQVASQKLKSGGRRQSGVAAYVAGKRFGTKTYLKRKNT